MLLVPGVCTYWWVGGCELQQGLWEEIHLTEVLFLRAPSFCLHLYRSCCRRCWLNWHAIHNPFLYLGRRDPLRGCWGQHRVWNRVRCQYRVRNRRCWFCKGDNRRWLYPHRSLYLWYCWGDWYRWGWLLSCLWRWVNHNRGLDLRYLFGLNHSLSLCGWSSLT